MFSVAFLCLSLATLLLFLDRLQYNFMEWYEMVIEKSY